MSDKSKSFDEVGPFVVPAPTRVASPHGLPPVRRIPSSLAPIVRVGAPRLLARIVTRVHADVPSLARGGPRARGPINEAVSVALDGYVDLACGSSTDGAVVVEHFRALGRAQALAGSSTRSVQISLQTAAQVVWEAVEQLTSREDLEGSAVSNLGRSLADYLHHLSIEVERGFAEIRDASTSEQACLLRAVIGKETAAPIADLASRAGWGGGETVVVMVAAVRAVPLQVEVPASASFVVGWSGAVAVVLTDQDHVAAAQAVLLGVAPPSLVAVSWPVPLAQARGAYRWARRALRLASSGRIRVGGRLIDCAEHRTLLWREADSELLETLTVDLLAPLLQKTLFRRIELGQTLERWLEFNESAPDLAGALGVHRNTVHNRLHELRDLFGSRLDDPEDRMALRACLGSMLPRWQDDYRAHRRPRQSRARRE